MTTVLIWNNNHMGAATYTGHASMNITFAWNTRKYYVSWFPDETSGVFEKLSVANNTNILQDLQEEGYAPDHIITIHDLDVARMKAEWSQIVGKRNAHYQFVRKNCASIVARVLKKGAKLGSVWHRHSAIWTPLKVKRLALDMGGTERTWTSLVKDMQDGGLVNAAEARMLNNLGRRDERHGRASGSRAYYANGRRIGEKIAMGSAGRFQIGRPRDGQRGLFVDGGCLYGGIYADSGQGSIDFNPD